MNVWPIWIFFILLFFLLALYHWRLSKKIIPPFQLPEIPYWEPTSGVPINTGIADADIKEAFDNFRDGFNSYIKDYNESSHRQNMAQAIGYLAATLVAILSLFLTI